MARGRIELSVVSRALEVPQDSLVDIAEQVPVFGDIEIDPVKLVDHLPDDGPVLHVVVGALEDLAHDEGALVAGRYVELLELGKQDLVDERL